MIAFRPLLVIDSQPVTLSMTKHGHLVTSTYRESSESRMIPDRSVHCSRGQLAAMAFTPMLEIELHLDRFNDVRDRLYLPILSAVLLVKRIQEERLSDLRCVQLSTIGISPLSDTPLQFSRLRHRSMQQH